MSTNSLPAAVRRAVAEHRMLEAGDRVLCALSGGADSVCLTLVLHALAGELGLAGLAAAHFSHGLRPEAAQAERQLCQTLCDRLGIPLFTETGDTRAHARAEKAGLEAAARTLRYRFLRRRAARWAEETGGPVKIATGHNLADQAETVLMSLIRGTGLAGLRGIAPAEGGLIRPLLAVGRADIEAFLAQAGQAFVIDPTNSQNDYTRNKVRNQIMPLVRQINPRAEETLARGAFLAGRDYDYLKAQAAEALAGGLGRLSGRAAVFDAAKLAAAHPALAGRAVLMAHQRLCRAGLLSRRHIEAVLALAGAAAPGGRIDLPGRTAARREYGRLILEPAAPPAPPRVPDEIWLSPGQTGRWRGWTIEVSDTPLDGGWHFDKNQVSFPLCVRQRRAGDVISMGKTHKTVKKLMIERSFPKNLRDMTPILCDNRNVLCIGQLAADRGRARPAAEPGRTVSIGLTPPVKDA